METVLKSLYDAIVDGDADKTPVLVQQALDNGIPASQVLNAAMISDVADAHTDGGIVAVVTADRRIEEYRDGMCQRSYCTNAQKVPD